MVALWGQKHPEQPGSESFIHWQATWGMSLPSLSPFEKQDCEQCLFCGLRTKDSVIMDAMPGTQELGWASTITCPSTSLKAVTGSSRTRAHVLGPWALYPGVPRNWVWSTGLLLLLPSLW